MTLPELTAWVSLQEEPDYRAKQIFHALYRRGASSVEQMPELPKSLREKISRDFPDPPAQKAQLQKSEDGTLKLLSKLADGRFVETVLIPSADRNTVCVSTQVGCAYACAFCASGQAGFDRNLTPGEITQQIVMINKILEATGGMGQGALQAEGDAGEMPAPAARSSAATLKAERGLSEHGERALTGVRTHGRSVTNIVFMGMGEPMANYDNVLKSVRILNDPEGLKIGARRITISTVGLVPMIRRLMGEGLQVELAISLHAPNDDLRRSLMPVNAKYPLKELIIACHQYVEVTNRIVTFEYILIDGINDSPKEARQMGELLQGLHSKVNLIPCHPTPNTPWNRPPMGRMIAFEKILKEKKVSCTLRRSRGLDIDGACGQLRLRKLQET